MKTIIPFLLLILSVHSLSGQIFGVTPEGEGKTWNIRFVIDPGFVTWKADYRDAYQGERYINATDSTAAKWSWAEWDSADTRVLDFYKVGTLRLGVLINVVDELYVGVNYSGYLIQGFQRQNGLPSNYIYWPFYALSGSINYDYKLPFLQERFSLQPTISVGTYQSERSFEGIGTEMSYEGRLGLAYQFKKSNRSQIRIWTNYQRMTYRSSEQSLVYPDRERTIATDWGLFSMGAGLVWHLTIEEDYDPTETRKHRRNARKLEKLERKREKLGGE